ncbi:MAG: hypothetical protein GYB53_20940 [Rhodobacteraceae bacterium]|uniref:hypothetical protein n=1 Tax=Oceanicola sp. S124 TaxID=1042378 RepID=UPI000255A950|nr:hypothetical protein [Oceanicola sp. S124]MBR9765913.1 hypothetical protein [Paracoccaceae bacterium]MBR9823040.1 hypothetical protein [Paracoccaceae bacterium]
MIKLYLFARGRWSPVHYVAAITATPALSVLLCQEPRDPAPGVTMDALRSILPEACASLPGVTGYRVEQGDFAHEEELAGAAA